MRFGERVRQLRHESGLGQRALGEELGVSFTYISKIENERLDFGDYPSEELIVRLAKVLGADVNELLLLAEKIPANVRKRIFERPDVFLKLSSLDDRQLDRLLELWSEENVPSNRTKKTVPR